MQLTQLVQLVDGWQASQQNSCPGGPSAHEQVVVVCRLNPQDSHHKGVQEAAVLHQLCIDIEQLGDADGRRFPDVRVVVLQHVQIDGAPVASGFR